MEPLSGAEGGEVFGAEVVAEICLTQSSGIGNRTVKSQVRRFKPDWKEDSANGALSRFAFDLATVPAFEAKRVGASVQQHRRKAFGRNASA